jgi:hypothetical protein
MTIGYWLFLLLIFPVIGAIVAHIKFDTIDWKESLCGVGAALLIISSTLALGTCSSQRDTETLSGQIVQVVYTPTWRAQWTELESYTTTDSKGNTSTHHRTVTKNRTYPPEWTAKTTLRDVDIHESFYQQVVAKYGERAVKGSRPNYDSGDRNDYVSDVKDDAFWPEYPMTQSRSWKNPLKNKKTLHNLQPLSEQELAQIPSYPKNETFQSNRIIGESKINIWNWDKLNSYLGPRSRVNMILVRLDSIEKAKLLQRGWENGKKNDLVICYDGESKADWCYVFGWSERELVKQNIQTLFLENTADDTILESLRNIVERDFSPHKWTQYEEYETPVPTGWVVAAFLVMIATQTFLYKFFHEN